MARHYSTKDFFRQMPNALLARYFQGRGLFGDLDFTAMKEGKPGELFAAWLYLPEEQRNAMDAEFRDIFEMSCEKGFRAIIDEARWQRDGLLTPGRAFGWQWSRDGEVVASIQVRVETGRVYLIYRHRNGGGEWKDEPRLSISRIAAHE